jgi:hypothetical protein
MSPSLVDVPAMSDGVNDNRPLVAQDLENDSIRAFSSFVETFELPLEREEFC